MERRVDGEALLDDGHQDIDGDGDPDLRLDSVLGGTEERLDAKMLLDPLEEQFDLPAATIQFADGKGGQVETVGEKDETCVVLDIVELDAPQRDRVVLARAYASEHDRVIAAQAGGLVDGMRIPAPVLGVRLGADDEEGLREMQRVQSREVQEAAVHHVETAWLEGDLVQYIDLVQLALGDVDERRDMASQIEQRMQFDCRLGLAKAGPGKQRERQVDRRGVERIGRVRQFHRKAVVRIEFARHVDEAQREVAIDAPVARLVGIGERASGDVATDAEVVELGRMGAQAGFDIAQTLPERQLREGHGQELIEMGERQRWVFARIPGHAASKRVQRQMIHQLGEHQLACIHWRTSGAKCRKALPSCVASSSR